MHILRALSFQESASTCIVGGETVAIRAYQIIVWISLCPREALAADAPRFPAVLDCAHNHNFSIREEQLAWSGSRLDDFSRIGNILVNREEVPLHQGHIWIHRNQPATTKLLPRPYYLAIPEGFAIHPAGTIGPRLPILGLRGIVKNRLKLNIDGQKLAVSLRT